MSYSQRFDQYFKRSIAQEASDPLTSGAQMEFQVGDETFTFKKEGQETVVTPGTSPSPQLKFQLTSSAADKILDNPSEDIGEIGVTIAKLIVSKDPNEQIRMNLNSGFLTLWNKGYLGVLKKGGSSFTAFLASKGMGGMGALKAAIKKMKD